MIGSGFMAGLMSDPRNNAYLANQAAAQRQALRQQQGAILSDPYGFQSPNPFYEYMLASGRVEVQHHREIKRLFIAFGADDAIYHDGSMRPVYLRDSKIPKIKRGAA